MTAALFTLSCVIEAALRWLAETCARVSTAVWFFRGGGWGMG